MILNLQVVIKSSSHSMLLGSISCHISYRMLYNYTQLRLVYMHVSHVHTRFKENLFPSPVPDRDRVLCII